MNKATPLHGIAALLSAGSIFYGVSWMLGKVESSELLSPAFAMLGTEEEVKKTKKLRLANDIEKVLYKNYLLGLLFTPAATLVLALQSGDPKVEQLGALSVAMANSMYSLHLLTSPSKVFQDGFQMAAGISHGIVGVLCFWEASKRSRAA